MLDSLQFFLSSSKVSCASLLLFHNQFYLIPLILSHVTHPVIDLRVPSFQNYAEVKVSDVFEFFQ